MKNPRIIIEVSGGCVTGFSSDTPVSLDVLDHDNMKEETDPEELARMKALEDELLYLTY